MIAGFFLTGAASSCKKDPVSSGCDTCKKTCDTCNLNQDSLAHIRDSLAHAFTWKEFINVPSGDADNHFSGVWVFGPNDMILVGASLWHFDGVNFTDIQPIRNGSNTPMDQGLSGFSIFALSNTDYWLVYLGALFHTGDGKHFDLLEPGGNINACWGIKSNDMFFVGNTGNILHYDGVNFTTITSNTTKDLRSVWGTSSSDVWACGANLSTGETVLLHYDGNAWSVDPLSQTSTAIRSGLSAVWAGDSSGHKFVATSGSNVYRRTDNGLWRNDSGSIPNALGGDSYVGLYLLSGNSPSDLMAAGGWGWVGHWNGKTWKKYDGLYDYNNVNYTPYGLSVNGNTACVVGVKSGQKWIAVGTRKQ